MQSSPASRHFLPLGPYIFLSTLLSVTLNLWPSLSVRDQVSHRFYYDNDNDTRGITVVSLGSQGFRGTQFGNHWVTRYAFADCYCILCSASWVDIRSRTVWCRGMTAHSYLGGNPVWLQARLPAIRMEVFCTFPWYLQYFEPDTTASL
jgi:hypothetical protein